MTRWPAAFLCTVTLLLAACGGGGGGNGTSVPSAPTGAPSDSPPSSAPSPTASSSSVPSQVVTAEGGTGGSPDHFTPNSGNSSSGGSGAAVDSIPCNTTMPQNQFHIHSFVGVLVNNQWYAMPDAVGMVGAGPEINGFVNAAQCFYLVHTHDSSGIIHQEAASSTPLSGTMFTLGNLLDIWGQPISSNGLGSFTGIVRVFVATVPLRTLTASSYTEFTGDPRTIPLYSHEAIWIEVGAPYTEAAQLPPVTFYTEY